jgi:hypothetical protein
MAKLEIRAYKQSKDARWYAGEVKPHLVGVGALNRDDFEKTDTSKGVCFGLSIWWIIKSARQEDFWIWMLGPGEQVTEIKTLFRSQRGEYDFTRFEQADKRIGAATGLTKPHSVLMKQGTQFKHAGYYYISLRGRFENGADDSGHAIAAYLDPAGKCRYFDPNVGEYETDSMQETLVELGELVKGYRIADLKIYWCCWN